MPAQILPPTTAGIRPEQFPDVLVFARNRRGAAIILAIFIAVGFALRAGDLGAESLGEDELNKLQTVEEYRRNGLSGKNGEHPFLMKGLQTVSLVGAEKINSAVSSPSLRISEEAALRFPVALFGTFTTLFLFLLVSELFGRSIGLVSAVLWAVEPMAVGFDRIAKEDSLVLFFFLLTHVFWIRGQTAAEHGNPKWTWHAWAAAAGFGALMASKYYPYLLGITGAYYIVFQYISATKWRMETVRWIKFFAVMGVTFVILNPTILLPDTWREMLKFSSENRIGHDSYEFMGTLYRNQMSAWLDGVPWTFFFVFAAVKTSLPTLVLFIIGLPVLFRRRLGDGRFFIFFWALIWLLSFTFIGGKFTRYFATAAPLLMIAAAVGFCFLVKWMSDKLTGPGYAAAVFQTASFILLVSFPLINSYSTSPHFRLFTNQLGGGTASAGTYFPHDEFYDAGTSQVVAAIVPVARFEATVACETPALFEYYAAKAHRSDLKFVSLSDRDNVSRLVPGDFIVLAKGRRYFSNKMYEEYLNGSAQPFAEIKIAGITAARLYKLDETISASSYQLSAIPDKISRN